MKYFENNTFVVPFDFSELAVGAVDKAIEMAQDSTCIHLIHVVQPSAGVISMDPAMPISPSYDISRQKNALQSMQEMFGEGKYAGLKIQCEIGDPGSEIVRLAKKSKANMIIMPSHGRSGLSRLFMGSVAERVLHLAICPVLILRGE